VWGRRNPSSPRYRWSFGPKGHIRNGLHSMGRGRPVCNWWVLLWWVSI
jgi:hypothetical protein